MNKKIGAVYIYIYTFVKTRKTGIAYFGSRYVNDFLDTFGTPNNTFLGIFCSQSKTFVGAV